MKFTNVSLLIQAAILTSSAHAFAPMESAAAAVLFANSMTGGVVDVASSVAVPVVQQQQQMTPSSLILSASPESDLNSLAQAAAKAQMAASEKSAEMTATEKAVASEKVAVEKLDAQLLKDTESNDKAERLALKKGDTQKELELAKRQVAEVQAVKFAEKMLEEDSEKQAKLAQETYQAEVKATSTRNAFFAKLNEARKFATQKQDEQVAVEKLVKKDANKVQSLKAQLEKDMDEMDMAERRALKKGDTQQEFALAKKMVSEKEAVMAAEKTLQEDAKKEAALAQEAYKAEAAVEQAEKVAALVASN